MLKIELLQLKTVLVFVNKLIKEVNNPESTKETIKSLLQAESPQGLFDLICVLLEQLSEVHPKKVLLDDFKRSLPERKITSSSSTGKRFFANAEDLQRAPPNGVQSPPSPASIGTILKPPATPATATTTTEDKDIASCSNHDDLFKGIVTAINATPVLLDSDPTVKFKNQLISKVTTLENKKSYPHKHYYDLKSYLTGKISLKSAFPPNSKDTIYAYLSHNLPSADEDEYNNQKEAHERFFRVGMQRDFRVGQPAEDLFRKISKRKEGDVFELDGISARSVVIALAKVVSKNGCFPYKLKFKIGETVLICKGADEKRRKSQMANFWLTVDQLRGEYFAYYNDEEGIGVSEDSNSSNSSKCVGNKLNAMIWNRRAEREIQLARLLTSKTAKFESFHEHEFNQFTRIGLEGEPRVDNLQKESLRKERKEQIAKNIHYLNGLNFLSTVTEVTRRLYRNADTGEMYEYEDPRARCGDAVPVGVFQARSRRLLSTGIISISDVYGGGVSGVGGGGGGGRPSEVDDSTDAYSYHRGGQYGIAAGRGTGINDVDEMEGKAKIINAKFESDLLFPAINRGLFQPAAVLDFLTFSRENMRCAAGKNLTRMELGELYGGDCESDGEDYSDCEQILNNDNEKKDNKNCIDI
eukprot:gene29527-38636_t